MTATVREVERPDALAPAMESYCDMHLILETTKISLPRTIRGRELFSNKEGFCSNSRVSEGAIISFSRLRHQWK